MTEASGDLEVVVRAVGPVRVASVRGDIDLDTSERLEEELVALREAGGPAVVDLDGVPFMDSSGLHVIVALWRSLEREGRALAVACRTGTVRKLFELTAVDRLVEIHDDAREAVRALAAVSAPAR